MFCSKCGKEIDDSAVVCTGCGCPTANYKKNTPASSASHPQASASTIVRLREYVDKVNSAYIFSILGLIFFAGIGLIFIIIAKTKINSLPNISSIPSDSSSIADYDSAKRKLASARKLCSIAVFLLILSVIIGVISFFACLA